jgi:hypothetical protein
VLIVHTIPSRSPFAETVDSNMPAPRAAYLQRDNLRDVIALGVVPTHGIAINDEQIAILPPTSDK